MQNIITWGGRIVLLIVLAVCVAGALDPHHNAARSAPPPDAVEHLIFGYLLTVLTIVSLPRVKPWMIAGFYLALGVGLEVTQIFGIVSGTFQWKDVASNVSGVAAALVPMLLAKRKAR